MNDAFSVADDELLCILKTQGDANTGLVKTTNSHAVNRFCEMCLLLNIDPLNKWALHLIVILMCKNPDPFAIADKFAKEVQQEISLANVERRKEMHDRCINICSTMTDWISLFGFFETQFCTKGMDPRASEVYRPSKLEVEQNNGVVRMTDALTEAQVVGEQITPLETALWALLYISPRPTPAGSMLERMYSFLNSNARDSELRCLRAMSIFNDNVGATFTDSMSLVVRCFDVKKSFSRLVQTILRQSKDVVMAKGEQTIRPLLRTYATNAVHSRILKTSSENWSIWRSQANFPITTSTYVQKLLYFICVQVYPPDVQTYEGLFHEDLLQRVSAMKVHDIDVTCVIEVMDNLRTYNGEISNLIDFRHKCLFGINEKARQQLTLTNVLQLYISIHQHPSIIETCWRHVIPMFNHTIRMNIEEFKAQHPYYSSHVVKNLVQNILD